MFTRLPLLVTAACLASLLTASIAAGQQSGDQQKCLNSLNKDGSKVSKAQGKENSSCLKKAGKGQLVGTAQACLTADEKLKVQSKKDKTIADDAANCGAAPDFGYLGAGAVNTSAVQGQLDLVGDVFGANLDVAVISCATSNSGCLCQQKVLKDVEKLAAKKLGEFVKCKKQSLKDGGNSAASLVDCVQDAGTAGSIAADTKGKIQKARTKLGEDITGKCDTPGVTAGAFPGDCTGQSGTGLRDCLDRLVECRVCQTINEMDGILVNCDLFDDGIANSSCASGAGPTPTPTETPTTSPTPTETATGTATPTVTPSITPGGPLFAGALLKTTGRYTYSAMIGIPGANTSCNANYPGTHACSFPELLAAETNGDLVGATDTGANLVTSLWAIDSTHPVNTQCGSNATLMRWDYQTVHTGVQGEVAPLNNGTGDLGSITTALNCINQHWVGCCY